ncbi:DUF6602 domain-containing protein [Winogradskyella sp. MH6]|uniref:DUF6602 domain-containing protein n=1 Tax=Winogradskyella sp. MH6 TaxID=2929510 RepID=UPI001FB1EA4D|nr:DUF6602 domain-containing protein [Winogradskyella sp. MH6]
MSKIDIKLLFAGLQKQMIAQLNTNREFITHPGSKGDSLENAWIEWLRTYLPNRYNVDKAIVIDSEGSTSHQMDIVIYDNWYTPFIFTQNGFHYIPAEGVYAVFEVKPDIKGNVDDKNYIEYSAEKIESVRVLKRKAAGFINGGIPRPARPLTKIIGGILCSTNTYTRNNNSTIKGHIQNQTKLKTIDLGCIADYGSFYVDYDPNDEIIDAGHKAYLEFYNNRTFKSIKFSKADNSMVTFFFQLTRYLQQAIGTIPAINLKEYLDNIGEKLDEEI